MHWKSGMDSILNHPSSPSAAGFPFHWRLIASRGGGAPGLAGNARPPFSARRISIASSSPSLFRRGSKRTGSVDSEVIINEAGCIISSQQTSSRRFTWSKDRTKFLTNYLTQQASDAKGKDALFREDTLRKASEVVSQRFKRECSVADVQRKLTALGERWQRIEKMKSLGSASWDHATRTISMREEDYQQYSMVMGSAMPPLTAMAERLSLFVFFAMKDHPKDSGMLNRPIEDYDELSFIFSDEYDPSTDGIQLKKVQNSHSDDSRISEDPVEQSIAGEDTRYLVLKIGELIDAIKSLKPRDFADDLWKAVTACGYNDRMSITAFEYFLKNEVEGKIFLVRSPDLRKEWLAKFFSSLL